MFAGYKIIYGELDVYPHGKDDMEMVATKGNWFIETSELFVLIISILTSFLTPLVWSCR